MNSKGDAMNRYKMIFVAALAMSAPLAAQTKAEEKPVGTILFARDSDTIDRRGTAELDRIAKLHAADKGKQVVIRGHTDSAEGDEMYGYGLSQRRANEVRSYLVGRGVPPGSTLVQAFSLKKPLVKGANPKNRRVDIVFAPGAGW
jgi:OmpA-OmpF porin, OOP family